MDVNVRDSKSVAIGVKYICPTNTRGAKVKAFVRSATRMIHKVEIPWDHEFDNSVNYCNAAKMLVEKMHWSGNLVGGWLGDEYVCVFEKWN